jgi:hypothetical protein
MVSRTILTQVKQYKSTESFIYFLNIFKCCPRICEGHHAYIKKCKYQTEYGSRLGMDIHKPNICHILTPFQNIRCFRFVKQMYLDTF